jgi:hypothetical protein
MLPYDDTGTCVRKKETFTDTSSKGDGMNIRRGKVHFIEHKDTNSRGNEARADE